MICVPDLARGMEQYRRLGFNVHMGGVHPGKGTHNAIAFCEEDYIELLAVRDPAGQELRWKTAMLGPANPLPIFFIQHLTPMAERRKQAPDGANHPNGVRFLERAYIVTRDIEAETVIYAKVLGTLAPRRYKGTVIMSHMAVFQFGPTGLTVAQPHARGMRDTGEHAMLVHPSEACGAYIGFVGPE